MRKILFILLLVPFLFASVFTDSSNALTIEQTNTDEKFQEYTYKLYADPPVESTAMQLRLAVTGATVLEFSGVEPGRYLTIGTCGNGSGFNNNQVCLDYAVTEGRIESGDLLGTLRLKRQSPNTEFAITKQADNSYLTLEGDLYSDNGNLYRSVVTEAAQVKGLTDTNLTIREPRSLLTNTTEFAVVMVSIGIVMGALLGTTLTSLSHVLTSQVNQVEK